MQTSSMSSIKSCLTSVSRSLVFKFLREIVVFIYNIFKFKMLCYSLIPYLLLLNPRLLLDSLQVSEGMVVIR